MNEINIGKKISAMRKNKGLTQEDLANFLGVSKPAVSKWESGQSYPDITLLPVLATYFNISVDELIGYEPQLCKEDVKNMYVRLCKAFAAESFEKVYAECKEYEKKYYSCWSVQFHVGTLLVNHANLAGDRVLAVIEEAIPIFERVANQSDDISLARQAMYLQAYCYLVLNQPAAAIDLIEDTVEAPMSGKMLLSKAYFMKGDHKKSKQLLQSQLYTNAIEIIGALPDCLTLYADDPSKAEDCLNKILGMGQLFGIEKMHPSLYFSVYLTAAQMYVVQGNTDKALTMLEKYTDVLAIPKLFPLKLHGSEFFDSLDEFFGSLDLGIEAPRSDEVIKQSIKDSVLSNPAFEPLRSEKRYQQLEKKLNELI